MENGIAAIRLQHFVFNQYQMAQRTHEEPTHAFATSVTMFRIKHFKVLKVTLSKQETEIFRVFVARVDVQAVIPMVFVIQKRSMRLDQWN